MPPPSWASTPYRAPIDIYLDKLGLSLPWAGSEATRWGDLLEPVIASEYARITGMETARTDRVVRHPRHAWMLGNPDRVIVGASKGVEIKTAGVRSLHRWGDGPEDCPEEYIIQCAWYMAVCGCDAWDLVALLGGQNLRIYTLKRDRELEDLMIEAAERFWFDHVLARVPPPPDGSESFRNYLASKYPRDERPVRPATAEEEEAGEGLKARKTEAEALGLEICSLENRIKSSMEAAAVEQWDLVLDPSAIRWDCRRARRNRAHLLLRDAERPARDQKSTGAAAPERTQAVNIEEKIHHLIDLTARVESGGRYDAWNPDDKGKGVSCGLIQFNQALGSLFELISRFAAANPQLAYKIAPQLHPLNEKWFRSVNLNAAIFKNQLLGLLRESSFQPIQRQLAREEYFDPAAKLCAKFGLVSERAHAMAFDVAVQYGVGGLERMFNSATTYTPTPSDERTFLGLIASYADMHEYDASRRHKLLDSRELSDEPMFPKSASETSPHAETRPTLRRGDRGPAVIEALTLIEGHPPIGDYYGPGAELAVRIFQAKHGLRQDGICGPQTWAVLLGQAAREGGRK